jgi:CRISPR-associated endonuclease/helicase Cas3
MPEQAWAHSKLEQGAGVSPVFHALTAHLHEVSRLAAEFAGNAGADWAQLAGLWHDLGKFRPGFQAYIRQTSDAHLEGRLPASSEKSHSAAGALHAMATFEARWGSRAATAARPLAYVIAGHHAGLADWHPSEVTSGLSTRLLGTGRQSSGLEHQEAAEACKSQAPGLLELPARFDLPKAIGAIPGLKSGNPLALATWIRMLFSALVDADFLDTEAFMDEGRRQTRAAWPALSMYRAQLTGRLDAMARQVRSDGREDDSVMRARADVLAKCRAKALLPPGVFTLTVPTGGGKTLSSLAFALEHAAVHGHRRIIHAIPYTSIIEQTADVFKGIFGSDAVVEHHSQSESDADGRRETARSRLACENWDAPLIVTTNVQLLESLFAARTSRCRKLHRIAHSVIVMDEAQLLPPDFLQPVLDVLRLLVDHYGVTLLLCSATQPVLSDTRRFDARKSLRGLPPATAIVEDEVTLFQTLRRTRFEWPSDMSQETPLEVIADSVAQEHAALAIVNTRVDAADLLRLLDQLCEEPPLHLSAAMCGQHRADVISQIRQRLEARRQGRVERPLRVVSTQLVEAGVDIDFPVVFRALAGMDSLAQAAGRCNREGRLAKPGRVIVFIRDIPRSLAALRHGVAATRSTLAAGCTDPLDPLTFERYFPVFQASFASADRHGIVDLLSRDKAEFKFAFRTAAEKFRLVDDADQASVIVPYRTPGADPRPVDAAVEGLRQGQADRWLLRRLQRHTVQVRRRIVDGWQRQGDVVEALPSLFVLTNPLRYHDRLGLLPEGQPLDAASLVA